MAELVARAKELLEAYPQQVNKLAAAAGIAGNWEAGAISAKEAEAQLAQTGYNTALGEWPLYLAGLLIVIADEWTVRLPVEERGRALACALDRGELLELAAVLEPVSPAEGFIAGYDVTIADEERVNRLWDAVRWWRFTEGLGDGDR
jgi:hypothetical protein